MVLRRGGIKERPRNFCVLNTITQGGVHVNFFNLSVSQLRALATHRPIWGRVAQGALEL